MQHIEVLTALNGIQSWVHCCALYGVVFSRMFNDQVNAEEGKTRCPVQQMNQSLPKLPQPVVFGDSSARLQPGQDVPGGGG